MVPKVYITRTSSFFPNDVVKNDQIEDFLGHIGGRPSRVRPIILRQNGIMGRYYALDRNQRITHTNAQMAAIAINKLFDNPEDKENVDVLTCGTSSPDQNLPSQASMVHGEAFSHGLEIYSLAGVCLTGLAALKTAYMSIKMMNSFNAVCSMSELVSPSLLSKFFEEEYRHEQEISSNPSLAFEKDFLRYMLSDGAAALLLEDKKSDGGINLEIEFIEMKSFANRQPACMYMWAESQADGSLRSWKEYDSKDISERSVWCIKQNVKLLNEFITPYFVDVIQEVLELNEVDTSKIRYVIPHISSMYFYNKLDDELRRRNIDLPTHKWFTNLTWVGNVGSVAPFAALDELLRTKPLEKGDQILLLVPESGRFSFGVALLTVA
ncbi:MAG: StlD/DarB family beta-ketosynthase [Muribaculaceae bacterium]|nr:StlD/DarB family beta-ketosynthase [Muribaculaceae bacterium]